MIRKRLAGILLSVVLACGSVPATVFAQGETVAGSELLTNLNGQESETQKKEEISEGENTAGNAGSAGEITESTVALTPTPVVTEALQDPQNGETSGSDVDKNTESAESPEETGEEKAEAEKDAEDQTKDNSENQEDETKTEAESEAEAALAMVQASAGDSDAGGSQVAETTKFTPGTYTITANLYVPGELNTQLPGVTAYLTNGTNPLGAGGYTVGAPTTPMSNNASITIGEDGKTKTLTLNVLNPVFTLQSFDQCSNATIKERIRDQETYSNVQGTVSRSGRITQLVLELNDNSGKYVFESCKEFPTLLGVDWTVPLTLEVDLASIPTDSTVKLTKGENQTWKSGSSDSLVFIAAENKDRFLGVQIDGKDITEGTDYSVVSQRGSTYVDLNAVYLSGLSAGEHRITILFADGFSANTKFTIEKDKNSDKDSEDDSDKKGQLEAGTYTITANLSMPGKYNPVISNVTVYANNPNNPFGPTLDENSKSEVDTKNGGKIPNEPLSNNATLVVTKKGEKYLYLPVKNPIFTLQTLGTCSELKDVQTETVKPTKGKGNGQYEGSYGSRSTRIHMIRVKLTDKLKSGTKTYNFKGSALYAVPLDLEIAPTGKIALQLTIDYSSAKKTSKSTKVTDLKGGSSGGKTTTTPIPTAAPTPTPAAGDTSATGGDGTLKAGTYTVAANIWIDRSSSGLPLSPHLTSSIFPPKDPVSNNATVTIDENSNATVRVPIVIQSKVMSIKSISGLNIIDSSSSGGYLTSITVNLGKVTNPNAVITQSCTVSLDLGELAQTIAKKGKDQVWGATFQVNFSGVPSGGSGGGNVDVNALINGATGTTDSTTGTNIRIGVTESAELAALLPMMEEHKNDTEIKETAAAATSADSTTTANSTTDSSDTSGAASTQNTETKAKNAYLFTIEELDEKTIAEAEKEKEESDAEEKELTEEEKADLLSEQYLEHFTDGTYDLVYITAEQAENLAQEEDFKDQFYLLAQVEYTEKEEDEESEAADTEDTSDTDADGESSESTKSTNAADMYLAVSKSFVDKHAAVLTEVISKVKDSAKTASEKPQETAVSVVSLGAGTDSAETLELLNNHDIEITSGAELKTAVKELSEQEEYKDLSEDLCYVAAATAANAAGSANTESTDANSADSENADASADADDTANTESTDETASTEKIEITDADSLSAALDQALANKSDDKDADGDSGDGELTYSNSSNLDMEAEKAAAEALEPGTYTLSVNLYLPGERNTQLPGTTAYMTNPDNPLGVGGHEGIPMSPVADNATLVVGENGTKTVTVDIVNPVFTLQRIAEPQNSTILAGVKDSDRYEGTNGVGVDGRITQLVIELGDDGGIYPFDDCAEFPTLLETDWYVPLEMSVEFTTAEKTSDETTVEVPEDTADAATKEAAETEK